MKIISTISLNGDNIEKKRQEIKSYFNNTYDVYEELFKSLKSDEAFYQKAIPLRHPLIFYFGHTASFFVNKLILSKIISMRINPKLESIFAVGVDEMSWDDLDEKHYDWATVEETRTYRNEVRVLVNGLIDTLPLTLPIDWDSAFWVILMGCEHERIHLETSSVLIRQLDIKYVQPIEGWNVCKDFGNAPTNELLPVQGRTITHHTTKEANDYYRWDNEYGFHEATIPNFEASKYLVSNQEFLSFVQDNGYGCDAYWEAEGKAWRDFTQAIYPTFWCKEGESYQLRMMTELVDLPLNHPVEVNHHEAKAYCHWLSEKEGKKLRLPTEDEWYCLVEHTHIVQGQNANINLGHYASTMPVDSFEHNAFYDVIGNVWQWSQTPIYPFDGFEVHPMYDDFSMPTFDTQHNLIKGGSWISTGNETLLSARYAFRRHFFQHAGFRYVQSGYQEQRKEKHYEHDSLVYHYIELDWGATHLGVENHLAYCARLCLAYMKEKPTKKALDVGCAIGRSSFELARVFDEVVGIDYTARFIQLATKIKEEGSLGFAVPTKTVTLKECHLEKEASKVTFWQGDACNLKPIYRGYDLIFASNLIDRLYNPKKFLEGIGERLNEKGLLILTSPLDEWHFILEKNFRLIDTQDISNTITTQMSVWEKR